MPESWILRFCCAKRRMTGALQVAWDWRGGYGRHADELGSASQGFSHSALHKVQSQHSSAIIRRLYCTRGAAAGSLSGSCDVPAVSRTSLQRRPFELNDTNGELI